MPYNWLHADGLPSESLDVHRGRSGETRWSRRVFAYGTAHPDSIYQIGSITKTFTGLLLPESLSELEDSQVHRPRS
jgi:CubicO group peptidase (beta-lactamase class C family)